MHHSDAPRCFIMFNSIVSPNQKKPKYFKQVQEVCTYSEGRMLMLRRGWGWGGRVRSPPLATQSQHMHTLSSYLRRLPPAPRRLPLYTIRKRRLSDSNRIFVFVLLIDLDLHEGQPWNPSVYNRPPITSYRP